jgi:hypothetical protein
MSIPFFFCLLRASRRAAGVKFEVRDGRRFSSVNRRKLPNFSSERPEKYPECAFKPVRQSTRIAGK